MNIIIVTGISGMKKSIFLQNLINKAGIRDVSHVIKFEDALADPSRRGQGIITPTTINAFLDQDSEHNKRLSMGQTFSWITNNTGIKNDTKYVFLDIHLQYYKNTEYFPPMNVDDFNGWIANIDPSANVKIINLIDDVFDIWQVLKERENDFPNTSLTLREILAWRSLETLQSESLASAMSAMINDGKVMSYMVAIKHPLSTFRNLIIPDTPNPIYLSYAISRTRSDPKRIGEINAFRKKVHFMGDKHCIPVFDPVTIDELILQQTSGKENVLDQTKRWPIELDDVLVDGDKSDIILPELEIRDSLDHVKHQVKSRDLKLVGQASLLVVFRPFYGGASTGALAEIRHAKNHGIDTCIYSPPEDKINISDNPFDANLVPIQSSADFYATLERKLDMLAGRTS